MKLKKFNFKIVNSTNNLAHKIILQSKNKLGIVSAEKQVKGRGQYGKTWVSPKGNLYVSIFFPIDNKHFDLKKFTFINCLLVKKTISSFYFYFNTSKSRYKQLKAYRLLKKEYPAT